MGSLFIVPLMVILSQGEVPAADWPLLSIHPGAKVTLSHMKIENQAFIKVETDDVTFKARKLRIVGINGVTTDLHVTDDNIQIRQDDRIVGFSSWTLIGHGKKKE